MRTLIVIPLVVVSLVGCDNKMNKDQMENKSIYGTTSAKDTVYEITIKNGNGMQMTVISYGGIITSLKVPDRNGKIEDVVLGFESLKGYETNSSYLGALIGRYGNRIAKGKFTLDGKEYNLSVNNPPNTLHGGPGGFHQVNWKMEKLDDQNGIHLSYTSKNMEEGYPGNLKVSVTYVLTEDNAVEVTYHAETDKLTVVNMTQHSYFNLSGDMTEKILDHIVMINADKFIPVDSNLIPLGELRSVENTSFDFSEPARIGDHINAESEQINYGHGFDHTWVINQEAKGLSLAATVYHQESGRFMEVMTSEPGVQFYTGNFLDGTQEGKGGIKYERRTGLCLETQHFPDSPNQPQFPSTELRPGEEYHSKTVFKFSVK